MTVDSHMLHNLINVNVEVCIKLKVYRTINQEELQKHFISFLQQRDHVLAGSYLQDFDICPSFHDVIEYVYICELEDNKSTYVSTTSAQFYFHFHTLSDEGAAENIEDEINENEEVLTSYEWQLPNRQFHGMWNNLFYDENVKARLLNYASTAMRFTSHRVDSNIIQWNRVILLHGPPGTGKTSLCKALAQKLSLRLSSQYKQMILMEINSHSLFSKWFSESGKLVLKLFQQLTDYLEDEKTFVFVLIDEVESLTAARQAALSGSEPSDSIRVVNALLTQIDGLKRFNNVMLLATSNLLQAIDPAFIDRADIKQYIGTPNSYGIYQILLSCISELSRVGLIRPSIDLMDMAGLCALMELEQDRAVYDVSEKASLGLFSFAQDCQGLSGRSLRKLPFLAAALLSVDNPSSNFYSFSEWIVYFRKALVQEKKERELMMK